MPGWVPGGILIVALPSKRGHLDFRAQRCLDEAYWHFAKQIVAVALEDGMGLDVQHDV